jgi:hypothetical protein
MEDNWSFRSVHDCLIEGRSFLLAKRSGNCQLFVQGNGEGTPVATLSDPLTVQDLVATLVANKGQRVQKGKECKKLIFWQPYPSESL